MPLVFSAFKMSGYTPSQVSSFQIKNLQFCDGLCAYIFADLSALGAAVFLELSRLE